MDDAQVLPPSCTTSAALQSEAAAGREGAAAVGDCGVGEASILLFVSGCCDAPRKRDPVLLPLFQKRIASPVPSNLEDIFRLSLSACLPPL